MSNVSRQTPESLQTVTFVNLNIKLIRFSAKIVILESFLCVVYVFKGGGSRFGQWSQHLLLLTWSLVAFVFVKTYTSTLTSHYMSTIYKSPEINTFADLAASTTYKATVGVGSIQEIDLLVIFITLKVERDLALIV